MKIPDWWAFFLLGAAAWRMFQLLAFDEILDRPRRKLLRLPLAWMDGDELPENYRLEWARWITCPYCAGAWIVGVWWVAFQIEERWTLIFASLFALMIMPIVGHKLLAKEEDK